MTSRNGCSFECILMWYNLHYSHSNRNPRHTILCADSFYMSEKAMRNLRSVGDVIWANCRSENELVQKTRENNPTVILSEYFKITSKVMDAASSLRAIVVWGIGYDHVDVNSASERGLYVSNTRGSNAESVAEHVFAMIFALTRKVMHEDTFVRKGSWKSGLESDLPVEFLAQDLYKKTLGILGLGAIGSRVARIAHGFDMVVLGHDRYLTEDQVMKIGFQQVPVEELLRRSDFVTLHVTLTEETRGIIGSKRLSIMKPTAYLINTSRGAVVDEEALIGALKDKRIAGAALDVLKKEPIEPEHELLRFDNVILTPHCASNSREALDATSLDLSEEILRIARDEIPHNLVNRPQLVERGYLK